MIFSVIPTYHSLSTLLLKPCYKKQENYNEKLATNFVGYIVICCLFCKFLATFFEALNIDETKAFNELGCG